MFGDFHNKVQIKDVCLVVSGKSIPTKLEDIDGNNPYIKVADFNIPGNEKYITIAQRYVSDDSASYSKQIPEGSVIFAKNGAASMSNKKRLTKIRCCIDMNTMAVFPKNESILSDFLFATIEAMDVSSHVRQGAIPSISPKSIEDSYIAMPTMEEQYRYVSIAKHADKSGFDGRKSQFIEMFGNPVTNNKGWNTLPIKDVAPETSSLEKQTGKVWILNLDMIESNTGKVVEKVFENDSNLLSVAPFDEGNVLYSKLRPYLNKVVIPDGKGYATTELVPLRPNQKLLNLTFFSHLLRGDDFVTYANSISTGTKMPRMPLNDLRKFQCILPPMEKQNEFEEIAHQADKSGFELRKSIESIDKVIKSLIN